MNVLQTAPVVYPESDGEPMADNTVQYDLMTTIKGGLEIMYRDNPRVFVAGDLLWYPVEGDNKTRAAPDVFVALGRPKGDRGSYRQWDEGGQPPQVVFEILSPSNRPGNMALKREFYRKFGVEEYYEYDPETTKLRIWIRRDGALSEIEVPEEGFVSPLLGIKLEVDGDLLVSNPHGQVFADFPEMAERLEKENKRATLAERREIRAKQREEQALALAEDKSQLAELERKRAEQESQRAEHESQRAEDERRQKESLEAQLQRMKASLVALGIDPEKL